MLPTERRLCPEDNEKEDKVNPYQILNELGSDNVSLEELRANSSKECEEDPLSLHRIMIDALNVKYISLMEKYIFLLDKYEALKSEKLASLLESVQKDSTAAAVCLAEMSNRISRLETFAKCPTTVRQVMRALDEHICVRICGRKQSALYGFSSLARISRCDDPGISKAYNVFMMENSLDARDIAVLEFLKKFGDNDLEASDALQMQECDIRTTFKALKEKSYSADDRWEDRHRKAKWFDLLDEIVSEMPHTRDFLNGAFL